MQYSWPGNVRELQNYIERAVIICDDEILRMHHLPSNLQLFDEDPDAPSTRLSFEEAVANFEKELIIEALTETKGNQTKAAKLLNTSLRVINYKVKKYKIDTSAFKKGF